MTRREACALVAGLGVLALMPGCQREPEVRQLSTTFEAYDTVVTIKASCSEETLQAVRDRCTYFETLLSRTREGSDVWSINHAGGAPTEVAAETAEVIELALAYAEESGGLFDPTIGALSELWDFGTGVRPEDDVLAEAVRHVGWQGVSMEGTVVTLTDPDARLDLGGIAKGYIADDVARLLREAGCDSACINLGGNVYALGGKPSGAPWKVGIQDPNGTAAEVIASVEVRDTSVVTSGLYERQFELDGVRYHHILDPRTGYPVETDLVSSSLVCASSTDADATATWLFLLGRDAALDLLTSDGRFDALLIDANGGVATTHGAPFELL